MYKYKQKARFAKGFEKLYNERSSSITQNEPASRASEKRWMLDKWAWYYFLQQTSINQLLSPKNIRMSWESEGPPRMPDTPKK